VQDRAALAFDLHSLSPRERQVLAATALGLTNNEVAKRLDVSVHAVKFHLAAVYRKLGVANRTEAAVVYATTNARAPR
jgi:DNA-binding CsgD family transcriptional regulator